MLKIAQNVHKSLPAMANSRIVLGQRLMSTAAPAVTLRYFESRGRAQGLRYAMVDAGVEFKDDRVAFNHIFTGNWQNMRSNEAISGVYGSLPVLEWNGVRLSQTEAIAGYLYHKLGHVKIGPNLEDQAFSASLVSFAHQDIIIMLLTVLNGIGLTPNLTDEQLANTVQNGQVRLHSLLLRLEKAIGQKDYFLGSSPVMGDFFVFDALDCTKHIFGDQMLGSYPGITNFFDRMSKREKLATYLASGERPATMITTADRESEIITKIRSAPGL